MDLPGGTRWKITTFNYTDWFVNLLYIWQDYLIFSVVALVHHWV